MIIAIPHWGTDQRYFDVLDAWVEQYIESGSSLPFVVVTDHQTRFTRYPTLAVDVREQQGVMRRGEVFDRKGALMLEALKYFHGGVLFCDADAFVMKPIQDHLGLWASSKIAMSKDSGIRKAGMGAWEQPDVQEMNAGVLWFGTGCKLPLISAYRRAFLQLSVVRGDDHWLEQLAWSLVWQQERGSLLPSEFQWVPHRWGPNPHAVINHHHGESKFRLLSIGQPNAQAVACTDEQKPANSYRDGQ